MRRQLCALTLAALVSVAPLSLATASDDVPAQKATAVRQEVLGLLDRLAGSVCQFYRNGSWYEGPDAAAHLRRKFDYIHRRGALENAEQFIELGATKSSFSGRAYQVRCGSAEPQASQDWLLVQLAHLRRTPAKSGTGDTSAQ